VRAFVHEGTQRSEQLQRGARSSATLVVDAVRSALEGVDRAYFVYPIRPGLVQATAQFAQAPSTPGRAIVNMSQISARPDAASHSAQEHWLAEQVFNWSGLKVAHIRPTYFAEWLLYLAPMIRQGVMYAPFTTGRHAPIAGEDQGRVIVGILERPEPHRGQVYPLHGPVELTHDEIAGIVGNVLGRAISYQPMPIEQWAEIGRWRLGGQPPRNDAASLYAEADRITGRPGSAFLSPASARVAIDHTNGLFAEPISRREDRRSATADGRGFCGQAPRSFRVMGGRWSASHERQTAESSGG